MCVIIQFATMVVRATASFSDYELLMNLSVLLITRVVDFML